MASFLNTSRVPQTRYPLQIIHYDGPPKPKQPPRRVPSKIPFSEDGARSNAERENKEDLSSTFGEVELVDLTCLADEEGNCEISRESGEVGSDDGFSPMIDWEGIMPTPRADAANEASHQPPLPPPESSSQEIAVVIENCQPDSEADEGDTHETDVGLHISDRLEVPNVSIPEYRSRELPTATNNAITPEIRNGVKTKVSRLPSTPPTSPSMMNIEQSTQEAFHCKLTQATTHQPRSTEKKAEREVSFPISESTSSSSSSGSDTDDDSDSDNHATSQTRKRKRLPPAHRASHQRQSGRPKIDSAKRQKPSPSRKGPFSSRLADSKLASEAHSSGCDTEMRYSEDSSDESGGDSDNQGHHLQKRPPSIASRQGSVSLSRPNAENPTSTHALPPSIWRTRQSKKGFLPRKAQWHLSDITFHSLSANVSFLTALFRACSDLETLSPSHAVKLLENVVGQTIKLDDIMIKPLTPDTWFLTSLVDCLSDVAGCSTGQPVSSALPSLQANRANIASPRDHGRPSNDVDETSSDDEYLSDIDDEPSSSKKRSRWSKEDDNRLRSWKAEGKTWRWICRQFSNRSPGAVQVRWHTKLRGKA